MVYSYAGASPRAESHATGDSALSGVQHLLHAQGLQHQRQAKVLLNLTRQAEHEAEAQAAWQEKQERENNRHMQLEAEKERDRLFRAEQIRKADRHRQERAEMAAIHEEEVREAARAKVNSVEQRTRDFGAEQRAQHQINERRMEAVSARRAAAFQQNQAIEEARRQQLTRKQAMADELNRQKEELRQLQLQIRTEEEFLKESRREQIRSKGEADAAAKARYHQNRNAEKDAVLRRRLADMEEMRRLRADEARQRTDYIALHAAQAAERDEIERDHMRARLADKAARAESIARQRLALGDEMARARQQMQAQESNIRFSLEKLRLSGAAFTLPPDVTRSLESMAGGGFHLVAMRTASSPRSTNSRLRGSYSARPASASNKRMHQQQRRQWSPQQEVAPPGSMGHQHGYEPKRARVRPQTMSGELLMEKEVEEDPVDFGTVAEADTAYSPYYTTMGPAAKSTTRRREEELREVLKEEISKESQRQGMLAKTVDEKERVRLNRIFAAEREQAKERILSLGSSVGIGVGARA